MKSRLPSGQVGWLRGRDGHRPPRIRERSRDGSKKTGHRAERDVEKSKAGEEIRHVKPDRHRQRGRCHEDKNEQGKSSTMIGKSDFNLEIARYG